MEIKGIDVSAWQGKIDWKTVADYGMGFAILRITEAGNIVDSQFESNLAGCNKYNIPVGVYKYSYAMTIAEIQSEARKVVSTLNGRKIQFPVFLDLEYNNQRSLGSESIHKMADAFREIVEAAGYKFALYCNVDWYNTVICSHLKKYDFWIARYPANDDGWLQERLRPDFGVGWQYSSKAKIPGISGTVDRNVFYKDYSEETKKEESEMSTVQQKINKAIAWMEETAKDDRHGYCQDHRWGEDGDYDCSSAVITAWEQAGVPVKSKGATYTGNMLSVFKANGFVDVTAQVNRSTGAGLVRGDVLLNTVHHTAMYCGDGKEVEASINEKGTAHGGKPGDQTGKEFLIRTYRNYPWTNVLRYTGGNSTSATAKNYLEIGDSGAAVKTMQIMLIECGYSCGLYGADGEFGSGTDAALRKFQKDNSLVVDGQYGLASKMKLTALHNAKVSSDGSESKTPSKTPKWVGAVNTNELNVRTGAGTENPKLAAYPLLRQHNLVDVCDTVRAADGTDWYYVRIAGKYYGFVSSAFINRV